LGHNYGTAAAQIGHLGFHIWPGPCFDQSMSHGQPIRIETLGDLVAHDYGMNVTCEKCRHRADLDMQALIDTLGAGFIYVGRTLNGRLSCGRCGEKVVTVQIHYLRSDQSRFA
jgi:hypothetical protein